jgi:Neutral/alkaline non-lysosomal ceramidase, N-terminal
MQRAHLRLPLHPAWVFFVLLSGCVTVPSRAGDLQAGIAEVDVTPTTPVMLEGYASRKTLSKGVHDPLSTRAVAFEEGHHRLVMVALDNCGFYNGTAEPLRDAVLHACGLQPSELFLCATHTHSAPTLGFDTQKTHPNNVQYSRWLQTKLVEVARQALDHLGPVEVGVGSGSSPVGANRRQVVRDKEGKPKIVLGRNPSLLTDREVQVLKLVRPGAPTIAGLIFAYDTHSTALGPGNYRISGDVHGLAAQFLEKYYGPPVTAAGFAGASGNIDPWYRVLPGFKTNNGWIPEPILLGTLLGEEVVHVMDEIRMDVTNALIKTGWKTITVPAKSGDAESVTDKTASMNITVARLGEIAFVGWGGEVFNEIGQTVKEKSPFRTTFVLTHCNGAAGYLPTTPSYAQGGYEVRSSHFAPGADEVLIRETLSLLQALRQN